MKLKTVNTMYVGWLLKCQAESGNAITNLKKYTDVPKQQAEDTKGEKENKKNTPHQYQSYIRIVSSSASRSNDISPNDESPSPSSGSGRPSKSDSGTGVGGADPDAEDRAVFIAGVLLDPEDADDDPEEDDVEPRSDDSEDADPLLPPGPACTAASSSYAGLLGGGFCAGGGGSGDTLAGGACEAGCEADSRGGLKPFCRVGRAPVDFSAVAIPDAGSVCVRRMPSAGGRADWELGGLGVDDGKEGSVGEILGL